MKNKIKWDFSLLLLVTLFLSSGCFKKALKKVPNERITLDNVLDHYKNTKGLLTAAYTQLMPSRANLYFWETPEVLTDNAFEAREDLGACFKWNTGQLSLVNRIVHPTTGIAGGDIGNSWWNIFWKGVRLANIAIKYIPQSEEVSDLEKKTWVAQARLLRAYYYFEILEYYGPMPFFDEPIEVDFDGWDSLTRPSYNRLATRIAAECDTVIESGLLRMRQNQAQNTFSTVTAGFAYALKSRVLLYNASPQNNSEHNLEKWRKAAQAAKELIDLNVFHLVDISAYNTLFVTSRTSYPDGLIYRFQQNIATQMHYTNGVPLSSYGLYLCFKAGEVPTQELVDCFEMKNGALPVGYQNPNHLNISINPDAMAAGYSESDGGTPYQNRDERFYKDILFNGADYGIATGVNFHVIIDTYVGGGQHFTPDVSSGGEKYTTTGYYTRKGRNVRWYGTQSGGHGVGSSKVLFRIAEAYLNLAEAECELGHLDSAMKYLNVIRERAGQPKIQDVPQFKNTQEFLRKRIHNERRIEFCFEGLRFFDQRRWNVLDKTNRVSTGMKITKLGNNKFHYQRVKVYDKLSYTPRYMVLPIPQDEAKKMPNVLQPLPWR